MAPLTRLQKKALAEARQTSVIDPADRISKLPEEIQAHILSFLPAKSAVRTCVLARTWRDVWKSTKRLLIVVKSVKEESEFVDRLLRVRFDGLEKASLDACEIALYPDGWDGDEYYLDDDDISSINGWIHRVLECKIQILRIDIDVCGSCAGYLEMGNMPLLVSPHLTRLELQGVHFVCRCLNLDGCPALEHLEINECQLLGVRRIMSLSLRRLVITGCESNYYKKRIRICVPRLISLWLDNSSACENVRTPRLEGMPELVTAEVWIDTYYDECECDDPMACYHLTRDGDTSDPDSDSDDHGDGSGAYAGQNNTGCVILDGLAQATNLVLIANGPTFILRRDLRWCPTFSKLKTLVLSDDSLWQPADCSALACILEHAPLLEKLTVSACYLVNKYKLSRSQ